MAFSIMRHVRGRSFFDNTCYRWVRSISRIRNENSRFFARKQNKKRKWANEWKKNPCAGVVRDTFQFQQRRAYIDRQDNPPLSFSTPTVRFCIDMCLNFSRSSRNIFLEWGIFCRWCTLYMSCQVFDPGRRVRSIPNEFLDLLIARN